MYEKFSENTKYLHRQIVQIGLQDSSQWPHPLPSLSHTIPALINEIYRTGRSDAMSHLRLGNSRLHLLPWALSQVTLEEASCHVLRTIRKLSGEACMLRESKPLARQQVWPMNHPIPGMNWEVDPPAPDDCRTGVTAWWPPHKRL